ncbi:SRPBCC domain-containing protein [Stutzerimonas nitrititolerans]|uniref:SRPBCC domain-containing protein n=1 Tax=Stutzerimonas nitrititolerans TaxID=2482751 RepID=UPI0035E43E69
MKITVETRVKADLGKVWDVYSNPADIKRWNAAQADWHTTSSTVDLREGGTFMSRMEAKDGSEGRQRRLRLRRHLHPCRTEEAYRIPDE